MAALAELARSIGLETPAIGHLQRLVASWGLLSDLCFSDLLLYVRVPGEESTVAFWTIIVAMSVTLSGLLYYFRKRGFL